MKRLFTILLFSAMLLPWISQGQTTPATLPYSCGFEDATENANWTIENGTTTNKFYIGSVAGANDGGTNSLYISDGANGATYNYSTNSSGYAYAYREFTVTTAGAYAFSFDWKAYGESSYDYIRVFIVPSGATTALTPYSGTSTLAGITTTTMPADWIAIDGGNKLNLQSSWQTYLTTGGVLLEAGTHKIVFYWRNDASGGTQPPAAIDNIQISPMSCPTVGDIVVSDITTTDAVISWQERGEATQWIVEYDTAGFTLGTGNIDLVLTNSISLQNLNANTKYDVYVRAFCSIGDTSVNNIVSFRTSCDLIDDTSLPLTVNFDTWTSSNIDPCFVKGNNSTSSSSYPNISTYYVHSGSGALSFYANGTSQWLILPKFASSINQLQLSFWLRNSSYYTSYPIILGVVSDNTDISTFDTIFVIENSNYSTWEHFVIPLGFYQGNDGHLAFLTPSLSNYSNLYLDDVVVEALPLAPCPRDLSASATGTETAIVRWTNTGAAEFQVEYGVTGFTLGTGMVETAVGDSLDLYSLTANTIYDVYLRAYCGGDSSEWIGPVSFHTACEALTDSDLPYFESFTSWISTTNRNLCYTLANNYNGSLSQPSLVSTPSADSTNSIYMYSGETYASWMSMPAFDTYISDLQVSFSMYKSSTYEYPLIVGVMTTPNDLSTFDTVSIIRCSATSVWENFVVPLSSYQGEGQYITFLSPNGVASGNYIDNITIDYLSSCPNPINLSARAIDHESAVVYYTATSTSGNIVIEYGPIGFQLGTGSQEIGYGDSTVLFGLNPITTYEVYVYTDCGGEQSNIGSPVSFRTACSTDPIDISFVPYNENFDSYTTNIATSTNPPSAYPNHTLPSCWNFVNMNTSSTSYPQAFLSQSTTYAVSGNCLFFRSSNTTPIYAVLPEFSNNIEDLRLRFTYRNEGISAYNGTLSIGVMTDPTNDSTFCALETFAQTTTKTEIEYVFSSDTIVGMGYYIAFRYTGGSNDNYWFGIDNVIVDLAPECNRPSDVAASNIQSTQAELSWVSENGTSFEIAYGPRGFSMDSINDYTIEYASDTTITLYNLTTNTYYDVYVRAYCSDFSEWSNVYTFKTKCEMLSAPYSENFNSYSGNGVSTSASVPSTYPNHTTPDCWSFNMSPIATNGTKIFMSSTSDYRVGNSGNCLFFNGNNAGAGYAVLPQFSNPIDSLYLEFTYRYEDPSYGYGILGVMTDPTIDSTFIPIDTLGRTSTLTTIRHAFWDDTLTGTGYYIAIKWHNSTSSTVYYFSIDDVSVTVPICRPTTNIMATNITSNSADITWTNATADSYVIAYSTTPNFDPATCTTTVNATGTTATITGLNTYTQYFYSLKTMCGSEDLGWSDTYSFLTAASCSGTLTQVEPIIGTDENVTADVPFYSYSSSYWESFPEAISWQLYTSQEIEMAGAYSGNINSISFQYESSSPMTLSFKVYMAQTSLNAFDGLSDTISLSQMTLVYNGTKEFNSNDDWSTIILDTPFQYSNTSNLVVAIERNADVTTEGYFKYTSTSEDRTICKYKTVDSYYDDEYYYGTAIDERNNIMFNMCTDVPPCTRPRNVVVSNVQTTQVDVSYRSDAASFEIAYGPAGFDLDAVGTYQIMQSTDTFATITNLTPGTRYDVYVRAICSATETSDWSFAIRPFFTSCVSQALPYTENFDSYTTDVSSSVSAPNAYPDHIMPNCWSFINMSGNSSSYPQAFLTSTSSYVVTGNCLFFKSSKTTPIYSVLPKFDASIDSLYIEFAYRNEGQSTYNGTLSLGVMTDPSNPNTFVTLETYQQITAITAVEHYFALDTVQGTDYYIAFRYSGGSNDNYYLSIDDIFVGYAPTCYKPRNLTASNPGQTTIDLIWNDPNSAGEYVVEYKKSMETAWTAVYGITDTFTTVTNLSPSSNYEFRVKAVCGMYDSSYFGNIATARTLCGPVQLPFGEDFSATGFLYDCWSKLNGIAFGTTAPSAPSSSYEGFGYTTTSNGLQGSHVKVNIYGTSTKYWLVTPEIDLTNESASQLTFDLALTKYSSNDTINATASTYDDKFMVIVSTDTGNTWLQQNATIWSDDTTINADYSYRGIYSSGQQITIDLSQYAGNIIKIAFYAESTVGSANGITGGDNDLHIDNILVSAGAGCPIPTMTVTPDATTATLTWTSTATDFEIEYKEESASDWSQTIAVSNTTSYTLTGLAPETNYMIRLRAVCEEGEYSAWKNTTITTPALPCLAPTNVTATTIGLTSATITWTDPTNNQTSWTIEYGYGDNIQTVTATTTSVELTNLYSGTTYTVRVQGSCAADVYSDWSDAYSFTTAACQTVSNLVADGITSSSATITWTAPAGQTKWELSYGMQGVDEEHGTKVIVENNPTYTIEGLEEDMTYDVYVRAICQEGVYSAWSTKLQFTTRPVSINTAANDNVNVRIYPNPANTEATISVEGINGKVEFAVADMNGRMIVTETINCEGQLVKTIDVSNLAKGAYFVHIYNDNFNTTRKLIVK